MKILILPSWYPTQSSPMAGNFFREQALALKEAGHEVDVLAPPTRWTLSEIKRTKSVHKFRLGRWQEVDSGVRTFRESFLFWPPGVLMRELNDRFKIKAWEKTAERFFKTENPPDIIHSHSMFNGGVLAAKLRSIHSIPTLLTEHASMFVLRTYPEWSEKYIVPTLNSMDKVIAVGPSLAESLRSFVPTIKVEVLGNIIDTEFFTPSDQFSISNDFIFTLIGSLVPVKGIDVLIRAFADWFVGLKVRLIIAGDGPERNKLKLLTDSLGIRGQVQFIGTVDRSTVRDLIQTSDVVVSSSLVETFGVTLAEALSCGKPVIATRSGGPESFVHDGNGYLVPVRDSAALGKAMEQVISNYETYDQVSIRQECINRFSRDAIVTRLNEIYHELITTA